MSSENKEDKGLNLIVAKEGSKPLILSPEKLKEMILKGEIKGDDLIYRDNLKVWTKARGVKGLRSLIARLEAKLDAKSTPEEEDLEEDLIDELLNDIDADNEKRFPKESNDDQKNTELPPILASIVAAKNVKSKADNSPMPFNESGMNQAISRMLSGEIVSKKYPERKLTSATKVKTYIQYSIIGCFLLVLLYQFFPRSSRNVITATEYLYGGITLDGTPLRNGSIVVMGPDAREVYGLIEPNGTYRVEVPPKGILKLKIVSFPFSPNEKVEPKKDTKTKAKEKTTSPLMKYASYENEISIDYQGGKKVFDLILSSK